MNFSSALDNLEISLIELEYAAADFADRKASIDEPGDLGALLSKLVEANRALLLAIDALGRSGKATSERRADASPPVVINALRRAVRSV
jgi:hypothetical protein